MISIDDLKQIMCDALPVYDLGDGFRVSTQCLYPSNGGVSVIVRGRGDTFVVSDEGGALDEVAASGRREGGSDKRLRSLVANQGLKVSGGAIHSPPVSAKALPAAILLVANASKEVADWGLSHIRFAVSRNFKETLMEILQKHFHDNLRHESIAGESTKTHKFGNVIYLTDSRRLIVDPVVNDPSSINSRVVANMDVRMLRDDRIDQIIVYDDRLRWTSSDLALLKLGAQIVPFSAAEPEIMRRAA